MSKGISKEHCIIAANNLYNSNGHIYHVVKLETCGCYEIYRKIHLKNIEGNYKIIYTTGG